MGKTIKYTSPGACGRAALLILLTAACLIPGRADALDCTSCHGYPPVDSASRVGGATGQFPGSHNKHAGSGAGQYGYLCTRCHVSNTTTNHANGSIDMAVPINGNAGASYGKGTSFPVSNAPFSGQSCTNVSCHSDGTYVYTGAPAASTSPAWGGSVSCNSCHGNATYSDYRKAAPLYPSGSPKPNAHDRHVQAGSLTAHDVECKFCHFSTVDATNAAIGTPANHDAGSYTLAASGATYQFEDGDNITATHAAKVNTAFSYLFKDASHNNESTCSGVSCHPTGLAGTKAASKTAWNKSPDCTDCHKVNLQNNTGYHHALRNYSSGAAGYPSAIPGTSAGANDNSRRCTMCHVDHPIFSPDLNTSNPNGAAANLRTGIGDAVSATSGYSNADFATTGNGGICVSCHSASLYKDTGNVRVKNEASSTRTVAIVLNNYTGSSHEYFVNSVMRRDGTVFSSGCSKCHNGRNGEVAAFSSLTTATHDSGVRRLYAGLGTAQVDGNDANFCYRCHSKVADAIGGTKKGVANRDYYNAATMRASAEDSYTVAQKAYRHDVANAAYAGKHRPAPTDETLAYLAANKHVSCNDCHNPHEARFGNNSTNTIARGSRALRLPNVLMGATGTRVSYAVANTNWSKPAQATYSSPKTAGRTYQICFKCHSGAIDLAGSWFRNMTTSSLGAAKWTDLALEFNPANKSFHPVVAPSNSPGSGSTALNAAYLTNGWKPGDLMSCTDCHATDSTASKGPHGSSVKWMLAGTNKAWPYTAASANGTGTGTLFTISGYNTGNGTTNGLFCLNCHKVTATNPFHSYGDITGGQHGGNTTVTACVSCHIRVPHGGKVSRLRLTTNAPVRYRANGSSTTPAFGGWKAPGSAVSGGFKSSCSRHSGTTTTEAW